MKKIIFINILVIFSCLNLKSQIIIDTNTYYKYPKIEKYIEYVSDVFDTGAIYYQKINKVDGEHNKVGQEIDYFNGKIERIGYWNSKNDTFCIDSNKIIIFINPSKEIFLNQFISELHYMNIKNIEDNGYRNVSKPENWYITFNDDGKISEEVIGDIKITYLENYTLFEQFKNNEKIKSWKILKEN